MGCCCWGVVVVVVKITLTPWTNRLDGGGGERNNVFVFASLSCANARLSLHPRSRYLQGPSARDHLLPSGHGATFPPAVVPV
uniref:Secreted protein n=1 Tax=Plectus sambesii TaxID=2011161 RepID=A0A914XHH1_9BILA